MLNWENHQCLLRASGTKKESMEKGHSPSVLILGTLEHLEQIILFLYHSYKSKHFFHFPKVFWDLLEPIRREKHCHKPLSCSLPHFFFFFFNGWFSFRLWIQSSDNKSLASVIRFKLTMLEESTINLPRCFSRDWLQWKLYSELPTQFFENIFPRVLSFNKS